jgi:hypothetical protein
MGILFPTKTIPDFSAISITISSNVMPKTIQHYL